MLVVVQIRALVVYRRAMYVVATAAGAIGGVFLQSRKASIELLLLKMSVLILQVKNSTD